MSQALSDFVSLKRGNTYKSALLGQPGPVLLGLGSIERNGGFKSGNLKTYGGPSDSRILLGPGDIYVSLKDVTQSADLLGAVARVPRQIALGRLTQDTVKLVFKNDDAPTNYLYWLLRTPEYRSYCKAHSTGTTNLGLAREDFFAFPVPPLTRERLWVVDTIQCLDDKIELSRRMNETLEAMAQAIFRDWFVDFGPRQRKVEGATDPVKIMGGLVTDPDLARQLADLFPANMGENGLPEGWREGSLGDVARTVGTAVMPAQIAPETPYIGLEHMPRRSIALTEWEAASKVTSNKSGFQRGQILFGKLRPYFHKVGLAPVDGVCSTDIIVMDAIEEHARAMVAACVSSDEFVAFTDQGSTGTKMPRTSWGDMKKYPIALATDPVIEAYGEIAVPMMDKIVAGIHECRTLAAARDLLLPKLMSGEIRINNEPQERAEEAA